MATVVELGALFNTASGTKTVTATPAVNDLIVIITAHTNNTSDASPTDDNASGTYTAVETRVKAASADKIKLFIRNALITSAVSTIFSHVPGTSNGGGVWVLAVQGMTKVGAAAKAKSGGQDNQTAGGTPTVTWTGGGSASSTNPCVGAVFNAANPAGLTAPTLFTEINDIGYANPTTGLEAVKDDSGFTGASVTWGSTSAAEFASVALELDASGALAGAPVFATDGIQSTIFGGAVLR